MTRIITDFKLMTFFALFVFFSFNASARTPEDKTVSLNFKNVPLIDVVSQIEKQTSYLFVFDEQSVDMMKLVSISTKSSKVEDVLNKIFTGTNIMFKIEGKNIVLKMSSSKISPKIPKKNILVTGVVLDEKGEPVIGASVVIPGTQIGVITDLRGQFSLEVPTDAKIRVSYIGYEAKEEQVNVNSSLKISLDQTPKDLDEVVVVGYSTQKKATITGSVAAIGTKDLLQSTQANISNALAGRMPGLLSVQSSGEPGKDASTLRIRGIGTFAGSQDPLIMVDGIESDNYNNIDPNEVESLSILKDASATAVYGVRGANGVILITTKRGELGKPKISLSTNVAATSFPFLRGSMNSYDFASSLNQAKAYDSFVTGNYSPPFSASDLEKYKTHSDPIFYPDMDWYKYMLKDYSFQTQSNLNISGGTDRVKYFVSLGYFTQEGMLNDAIYDPGYDYQIRYKRYNFRSNFDINVTKNLFASFDISDQIGDLRNPNWDMGLLMESLSSSTPIVSPGVINNKIITIPSPLGAGLPPPIPLSHGWNHSYENNINGSLRLNYKMDYLLKGLSLRGAISYKNSNTDTKNYLQNLQTYNAVNSQNGILYLPSGDPSQLKFGWGIQKRTNIYMEGGVSYVQKFGDNNISGLILYDQSKTYDPNLAFLIPSGYQGLVGRVTYNYKNRYLAEFNIGYNGTENFAQGMRFGTFPAYSVGWVATDEPFFPQNKYITFIKIRGSYGTVGNDKIGGNRFLYRPTSYTYTNGNAYYFGTEGGSRQGYTGSLEGKMGNPVLTWEKAVKTDIGADLKFLDNKISLTFDYFQEQRDNILWNRGTIPAIMGADMPAYNLGKMKNSGFDGEITFRDKIGKFNYFIKGNYTYAHNEIVYQDEVARNYDYLYVTGQRYGQFFGFVADGLFNSWTEVNDANRPVYQWNNNKIQPGDIRYEDINGDGKIDDNDRVPIGYSNFPEVMFGISLGGEWKGFDFSVLFQGADKVSNAPSRRTTQGFYINTGANNDLLKSWSQQRYDQGLPIVYPRFSADNSGGNYALSTYWLEDASYVRLKNAEIGYTLSGKTLKKIGLSSVRIYMNGNNLITWCHLFPGEDPEYPTGEANSEPYPVTRVYNMGLNINF
jgi:TonB-linked SusC/RagA family outer membrane protein